MDSDLIDLMMKWRHALHSCPETAFEEVATADLVAGVLRQYGFEVHAGIGRTGVVGTMTRSAGPAIGLRADMDALPIAEANSFAHRSQHEGKMHACGHDGHTAMLLGAAVSLSRDSSWRGTVHVIFQPAEEGPAGGGRMMVEDGLFERFACDAVFGLHNWPGIPRGHFAINDGPMMASFDTFEIVVDGKGSHAAMPEEGSDVLVCASQIVTALQTIISRRISPKESGVVSVTQIHGGEAWNVLPDRAVIRGTVRCFSSAVQERIRASIGEISSGIARALGANATLDYRYAYPATVNSAVQADLAAAAAEATVGTSGVRRGCVPSMASEDFAFMLHARPGAYIWMGVDEATPAAPLHNPHYDFNDAALAIGASYWVNLVKLFGAR
ncbi:M20 family metallopeptidase [Paraburkholderia sp. RL18-101-BIB-B]|uniref:M20 aminoacylase family protein n=1 Tax=unclassified Paraburkholderia TaxID=2615204 RepID=UPI0038BD35C9